MSWWLLPLLWAGRSQAGRALPRLVTTRISPPCPSQVMQELLVSEDAEVVQHRMSRLAELFPRLEGGDLREVLDRSPVLLTFDEEAIETGLHRLQTRLPWCDPCYVVQQRVAGVELLLAFIAQDFDVEPAMETVRETLGIRKENRSELIEFIRRCPFAVLSKYERALGDHIHILESEFEFKKPTVKTMIEKFPGLLELDLRLQITSLNASLTSCNVSLNTAALGRVIKAVPRVLVQDVVKRISNLQELYPNWDISKIVAGYPRVLTHKYAVLDAHYQVNSLY